MRMIAAITVALVSVAFIAPASAQMSAKTRGELASMRAQNPTGYTACYDLALKRGYSQHDHENEGQALMNFISGCIAMRGH
jgi:hypothetical protein